MVKEDFESNESGRIELPYSCRESLISESARFVRSE
jgi:hypothetical protein